MRQRSGQEVYKVEIDLYELIDIEDFLASLDKKWFAEYVLDGLDILDDDEFVDFILDTLDDRKRVSFKIINAIVKLLEDDKLKKELLIALMKDFVDANE